MRRARGSEGDERLSLGFAGLALAVLAFLYGQADELTAWRYAPYTRAAAVLLLLSLLAGLARLTLARLDIVLPRAWQDGLFLAQAALAALAALPMVLALLLT